jgi:polyisoprenoid-binding protein YceI
VTRTVTLETEFGGFTVDPWGRRRMGLSARTALNRSESGVKWNQVLETGGVAISDRVEIEIDIEAVSQAQERATA